MKYQLTEKGKKYQNFIFQHIPDSGDYDYTDRSSYEDVIDEIVGDIKASGSDAEYDKMKEEAEASISVYDQDELLEQVRFGFPQKFGYIEEVEE